MDHSPDPMSRISNTRKISKYRRVDICPLATEQKKNVHKSNNFFLQR